MSPWPWDLLVTSPTTPPKPGSLRELEWPAKGTIEAPITEQSSTKMGSQFIHYPRDLRMRLCLQQKVCMGPGAKEQEQSGPVYCQRPSGRLSFSSLLLGSAELEVQVPHFVGDSAGVLSNQSMAAVRALGAPCIQEPASDQGYFLVDLTGKVILQGLSGFCRGQTRGLNEHIIGTLESCRSFLMVSNSTSNIPTRLQYFCQFLKQLH